MIRIFAILFLCPQLASAVTPYSVQPLDAPPPFVGFYTARLTDSGRIPGYARQLNAPGLQATVWGASAGRLEFLILESSEVNIAHDIRPEGTAVGAVRLAGDDGEESPAVFQNGMRRVLPLPRRFGTAVLICGDTIVGLATGVDNSYDQVAIWQNEQFVGLLTDLPGLYHVPHDINAHGRYVGGYVDIGSYGGWVGEGLNARELIVPGFPQTRGFGINDSGSIVGTSRPDGPDKRVGYLARDDGNGNYAGTRLLPLPGEVESPVWAINNAGDMVGLSTSSLYGPETATVYFAGSTTPVDMNTLMDPIPGVHLVRGIDINNRGQILVEGETPQGYRYYVLTPVPEPSLLGFAALLAIRRRPTSRPAPPADHRSYKSPPACAAIVHLAETRP